MLAAGLRKKRGPANDLVGPAGPPPHEPPLRKLRRYMVTRGRGSRKGNKAEQNDCNTRGLLSTRSALIILFAALTGLASGGLLYLAHRAVALTVFGGCAAFGIAAPVL